MHEGTLADLVGLPVGTYVGGTETISRVAVEATYTRWGFEVVLQPIAPSYDDEGRYRCHVPMGPIVVLSDGKLPARIYGEAEARHWLRVMAQFAASPDAMGRN